ncbi:MAG: hypothetical protein QM817_18395 [Archangium sp.]
MSSSSSHDDDPNKLPVPWKPQQEPDIDHFKKEWWSGTRGGGKVPKDFGWPTDPKRQQEENGSGSADEPVNR